MRLESVGRQSNGTSAAALFADQTDTHTHTIGIVCEPEFAHVQSGLASSTAAVIIIIQVSTSEPRLVWRSCATERAFNLAARERKQACAARTIDETQLPPLVAADSALVFANHRRERAR